MTPAKEPRHPDLFENVWQKAVASIDKLTQDDGDSKFLKSLVMGGTVAAESVVSTCDEIKKWWGKGTPAVTTELSQLFSLMMLSQIYRWVKEEPPKDMVNTIPPEVSAARLISIFGGEPEQAMDDFVHFDKQFEYDLKHHPHLIHVSSLLLGKSAEICGHKTVDWSKVKWPVVEMTHLIKGTIIDGSAMRSKLDIDNMQTSLYTGIHAMMSFYSRE